MNEDSAKILQIINDMDIRPSDFINAYIKNFNDIKKTISFFMSNSKTTIKTGRETMLKKTRYERIIKGIKEKEFEIINISEKNYPLMLKEIYFPPPLLFLKGGRAMDKDFYIAIVGTRKCSVYGRDVAIYFSHELSKIGITVVSGLASGIDYWSHKASVHEKGGTIGVLGCGIDIIYPPENKKLFLEIIEDGSIITEFLPGVPPLKSNFPARNRIISGMSSGVIIIEAAERSGALITANFALQQNREVFAVPGDIFNISSSGCHKLIKSGAKLAEHIDDILEELNILYESKLDSGYPIKSNISLNVSGFEGRHDNIKIKRLNNRQRIIYDLIGKKPVEIEELMSKSGYNINMVLQIISELILLNLVIENNLNQLIRL